MLRPIDMQVQFQAMPDVARSASTVQAGLNYRTVAELGQARLENLLRQGRVENTAQVQAQAFRPINREEQEDKRNRNSASQASAESKEKKLDSSESQMYGVAGMRHIFRRAFQEEGAGGNLDLSA